MKPDTPEEYWYRNTKTKISELPQFCPEYKEGMPTGRDNRWWIVASEIARFGFKTDGMHYMYRKALKDYAMYPDEVETWEDPTKPDDINVKWIPRGEHDKPEES